VANQNTPFGLQVYRGGGVYAFNSLGTMYSIPTSDSSNAYYMNDAVKAAASGDANGVPNVTLCAGTDPVRGSIQGILQPGMYPAQSIAGSGTGNISTNYVPQTKANPYYVIVDDDPSTIYCMQDDGITTSTTVAASCNLNFSFTVTAGASTVSKSATVILSSSFATTSSLNMKAVGLAQGTFAGVQNAFGAYAKWLCRVNLSEFPGSGFVGI
jgi:hypothetical protein